MAACCGPTPTIRRVLGTLQPFVVLLCVAAVALAAIPRFPNEYESTCAVAPPGSAANNWLCIYIYSISGVTIACSMLVWCMLTSLSWSRGSCYYLLAVILLLVPFVGWIFGGARVTQLGLDTNDLLGMTDTELRYALIGVAWALAGVLGASLVLRLCDTPGAIRQDDLDRMEAAKEAQKEFNNLPLMTSRFMLDDGRVVDRQTYAKLMYEERLVGRIAQYSFGFQPDTIDPDDYIFVPNHPRSYGWYLLPKAVDLRRTGLLVVLNQGGIGSCTANAAAAAMQYTVRRNYAGQRNFNASRMFLYYNARMLGSERAGNGRLLDTGATLRACCKAVTHFGVAPEQLFPYQERLVSVQPPPEAYEVAKVYRRRFLYRKVPQDVYCLRAALAQGFPIMCGLYFPKEHAKLMKNKGVLPMPRNTSAAARRSWDAHAVLMVGYDWKRRSFMFQNSWGNDSGVQGYFNAPMALVLDPSMAADFWLFQPPSGCASCASGA